MVWASGGGVELVAELGTGIFAVGDAVAQHLTCRQFPRPITRVVHHSGQAGRAPQLSPGMRMTSKSSGTQHLLGSCSRRRKAPWTSLYRRSSETRPSRDSREASCPSPGNSLSSTRSLSRITGKIAASEFAAHPIGRDEGEPAAGARHTYARDEVPGWGHAGRSRRYRRGSDAAFRDPPVRVAVVVAATVGPHHGTQMLQFSAGLSIMPHRLSAAPNGGSARGIRRSSCSWQPSAVLVMARRMVGRAVYSCVVAL
jgi:hypothetical protein